MYTLNNKKPIAQHLTPEILERFDKYYLKGDGCWEWTGGLNNKGYGMFYMAKGGYTAHRVSYVRVYGEPEKALVIDHKCANPRCIRPEHLEAVTNGENVLRGKNPPALNRRKTHCQYGHPLCGENVVSRSKKWNDRTCKICDANIKRRTHERWKARKGGSVPSIEEFNQRWLKDVYQLPRSAREHIIEYITELVVRNDHE